MLPAFLRLLPLSVRSPQPESKGSFVGPWYGPLKGDLSDTPDIPYTNEGPTHQDPFTRVRDHMKGP